MYTSYYLSPVGMIKIVCNESNITAVTFAEKESTSDDKHTLLYNCQLQLDEYFSGKRKTFNLPLEQAGTAFQLRVWKALEDIPFGRTTSYLSLSKTLGDPKAIRAVGSANGRNNIAIIIPCHRVIGSNTQLIGYAGGLWRKQWLLNHEAKYYRGLQTLPFD